MLWYQVVYTKAGGRKRLVASSHKTREEAEDRLEEMKGAGTFSGLAIRKHEDGFVEDSREAAILRGDRNGIDAIRRPLERQEWRMVPLIQCLRCKKEVKPTSDKKCPHCNRGFRRPIEERVSTTDDQTLVPVGARDLNKEKEMDMATATNNVPLTRESLKHLKVSALERLCDKNGVEYPEDADKATLVRLLVEHREEEEAPPKPARKPRAEAAPVVEEKPARKPRAAANGKPEAEAKPRKPRAAANGKPEAEAKPRKEPAERDNFGCRIGTQAAAINAVIGENPMTVAEIAEEVKTSAGRVSSHMRWMVANGLVERTENGYVSTGVETFKRG